MSKRTKKDDETEEFGAFEKHTKGIGMKLLLKMGFKPGQGLGKDSEGRAEPVQIKLRPKGVGIGFSDDEQEEEEEYEVKDKEDSGFRFKESETSVKREEPKRKVQSSHRPQAPDYDVIVTDSYTEKVEIIDMTADKNPKLPLSSLLNDLAAKKKRERSILLKKQNELDAALRELNRNIEEVQRERVKLAEIEKENEIKMELRTFIQNYHSLEDIKNNLKVSNSNPELRDQVISSVLIPVLQTDELLNQEMIQMLKQTLSKPLFSQIIYHLWWPSVKNSIFNTEDIEGWQNVMAFLKDWAHLLPDDFLVSFLGNQILLPRLHYLLQSEGDSEIVCDVWDFLLNYLRLPDILNGEIVTWLIQRIQKVKVKHFTKLFEEFQLKWKQRRLINPDDLQRVRVAWNQRVQRLLQRDLIIDPADQDLLPLESFFKYTELSVDVNREEIVKLLTDLLIPKLKRCVQSWLKSPQVDYEEVAEWYVAWKEIIPEDLRNESELMDGFAQILSVINENI